MKNLLLILFVLFFIGGCTKKHYVNVSKRHNFYENHRYNTYTSPTYLPNIGVVLETHIIRKNRTKKK